MNDTSVPQHHEVFRKFETWTGMCPAGYSVNFLGVFTRDSFFSMNARHPQARHETPGLPSFDEEYFEWVDLLESVTGTHEKFTMIELGAGWGRWLMNAVAAIRRSKPIPYELIGVEPEPTHFQWMKLHFADNGMDMSRCKLIQAAVSDKEGSVWFYVGKPADWYGQAIAPTPGFFQRLTNFTKELVINGYNVRRVKAITLEGLLRDLAHVDLIDLDVQGAELLVLDGARVQLKQKVKRVHIGTHGPDIESGLRILFTRLGWKKLNDYPCQTECDTPWGPIKFGDGVQTWINPDLP